MRTERLPIDPSNIEVLGHKVKPTDASWTGLDWSRAERRTRTKLAVPWCHPADQTGSPDDFDCIYAVRPRAEPGSRWRRRLVEDVWFEQDGKRGFVVVVYGQSAQGIKE